MKHLKNYTKFKESVNESNFKVNEGNSLRKGMFITIEMDDQDGDFNAGEYEVIGLPKGGIILKGMGHRKLYVTQGALNDAGYTIKESVVTEARNTIGLAFKDEDDYNGFVEFIDDEGGKIFKNIGWDNKTKSWEVIMDVKVLDDIYGEGTPANKESGWYGALPGDFESVIIEGFVTEGKDDFVARHSGTNITLKKGYKHHTEEELYKLYDKIGKLVKDDLKVKDVTIVFESVVTEAVKDEEYTYNEFVKDNLGKKYVAKEEKGIKLALKLLGVKSGDDIKELTNTMDSTNTALYLDNAKEKGELTKLPIKSEYFEKAYLGKWKNGEPMLAFSDGYDYFVYVKKELK